MIDPISAVATLRDTINAAVAMPTGLLTVGGLQLLAALSLIAMCWAGIKVLLEADNGISALANALRVIFLSGFAVAIIGGNAHFGQKFARGFDDIATTVARGMGGTGGGTTGEMAVAALTRMMTTSIALLTPKEANPESPGGENGRNVLDNIRAFLNGTLAETGVGGIMVALVNFLFKLFMALFVLLAALIYCGQLVVTQVLVNIGLLLMPIMVPWLVLERTTFVFDGWLSGVN